MLPEFLQGLTSPIRIPPNAIPNVDAYSDEVLARDTTCENAGSASNRERENAVTVIAAPASHHESPDAFLS